MLFSMLLKKYSDKEEPTIINYTDTFYGETPGDVQFEILGLSILPSEA